MKNATKPVILLAILLLPLFAKSDISEPVITSTVSALKEKAGVNQNTMESGVRQVARLWQCEDGMEKEFQEFCIGNYIDSPEEKKQFFDKVSDYLESIRGHFNEMTIRLQWNMHINTGVLNPIDQMFASYSPGAHLIDDLYKNKIGFVVALNFPEIPLEEKETLGTDRLAWAYARMGDLFTSRIPPELLQAVAKNESNADTYISGYNIYMGHVTNAKGQKLFPEDKILLTHWNLRDEIKANYNKGKEGLDKQRTVYEVMKRIISQEIPREVINSGEYDWNPYENKLQNNAATPENHVRYQYMIDNFHAQKAIDPHTGKSYIQRKFSEEMEVSVDEVKSLFTQYLSSPELKEIGRIISRRLGRKLEAFDIWYDGFKSRSNLDETKLDAQIQQLYPQAQALENNLANILTGLGFTSERASEICKHISVDAARGSGHAWGASMKGLNARLRTRIPESGMDYKGYNIAIHEFGHNVEQTISLYDVDYYLMAGVPNTSFTEALAFMFQKRDLEILGIEDQNPEKEALNILDKSWSLYEMMGVSMLDISVWEWLYAHPEASAEELGHTVTALSKEIWNKYYAPVYGKKDETVLAIYSHMLCFPLYLSSYAFGQMIEYQLEDYVSDKPFAREVDRIYRLGRLTPNEWMTQATGSGLSVQPLIHAAQKAIKTVK